MQDLFDLFLKVGAKSDADIEIPVFNYKGYVVEDDSSNRYEIKDGKDNVIGFTLPKGFKGNITVSFREPIAWRLSEIVSLLSIAALIFNAVMMKRRSKQATVIDYVKRRK